MDFINWKFEGTEVSFKSTAESFKRDLFKMAKTLGLSPDHKFIIHNGSNNTIPSDAFDSIIDTPSPELPTVSVDTKKTKSRKTTDELLDVSGNLAESNDLLTDDESSTDLDSDSSTSNWFDDQRV